MMFCRKNSITKTFWTAFNDTLKITTWNISFWMKRIRHMYCDVIFIIRCIWSVCCWYFKIFFSDFMKLQCMFNWQINKMTEALSIVLQVSKSYSSIFCEEFRTKYPIRTGYLWVSIYSTVNCRNMLISWKKMNIRLSEIWNLKK